MMSNKPNFTPRAQRAIDIARKTAKDLSSHSVSLEHLFLGILHLKAGVVHEVLQGVGINPINLIKAVESKIISIRKNKKPTSQTPPFSSQFKQVLDISSLISKNFGHDYIGIEHLLLAMLKYEGSPINKFFKSLSIPEDLIVEEIKNYFQLSISPPPSNPSSNNGFFEQPLPFSAPFMINPESQSQSGQKKQASMLEKYTVNLCQQAIDGKFDKIIGKEDEISEVCEILCRRIKNNPVLLGDPGVGKTAIVEGLAQAICSGAAPEHLLDKQIHAVDLSGMIAGTKYRGQFEERLKSLVDEAKQNSKLVLFVDEIHTMVGAGSAEGTMDAANILKPALSKGEIKCIGATTDSEYKKSILKDGALERRFQPVKCNPPTSEETLQILIGIKQKYEEYHYVEYSKDSLRLIVDLAERYIPSKQFPDKAIDILDQTGAKVKIRSFVRPRKSKEMEHALEILMKEEDALRKLGQDTSEVVFEQEKLLEKYSNHLNNWAAKNFKNKKAITEKDIYKTVSQLTKIPAAELSRTDAQRFINLEKKLKSKVIGQDEGVSSICKAILRSKAGLRNESKPIGSFLLLGQSGTGKTLTAKVISNILLGKNSEIIHLDMSEYSEKTASTKISGSSPGYVGYEEGSLLIDKISKNPYSVVLFDEIEKAHPDVLQTLLQILEEGRLTDALGRVGDFRNSIIIMTGNIGSELAHKSGAVGFASVNEDKDKINQKIIEKASELLRPEFVNRLNEVVMYQPFNEKSLRDILNLELKPTTEKLKQKGVKIFVSKSMRDYIIGCMADSKFGARPISRLIQKQIEDPLSELLISNDLKSGDKISFYYINDKSSWTIKAE